MATYSNPTIQSITLPSGGTYDLHDKALDELIGTLTSPVNFIGETTTELTDGSTITTVVIGAESHTALNGDIVIFGKKEFLFNGTSWAELGDLSAFGALAYKNSASGTITPAGSVSKATFTGTAGTVNLSGKVTASGSVAAPTFTGTAGTVSTSGSFTPKGSVSAPSISVTPTSASATNTSFSVADGVLSITNTGISALTAVSAKLAAAPTFTGTEGSVSTSGSFTPAGTNSAPKFTGSEVTVSTSGSFTPAGSISTQTFTGTSATVTVE
jgi:hypothetical protein